MPFGYDKPHSWLREDEDLESNLKPGSSDWFELSDDVSWNKPNNRHDTLKVESLLGYGGYMDIEKSGGPLGLSRWGLEKPIKAFQEKNGLKVDGLLRPGGPTITKMKELYGGAFGGTPAPTPAMMDAHVEVTDSGEDGFLHDSFPAYQMRPNRRLDSKAHLMEYERWNSDWARGSGGNPKSLAPEYENYIRDVDEKHGHDPGLIFARDLVQQVGKYHSPENGAELAKHLAVRLSDRPDLQRQFLGGEPPKAPPIGTFKPGGEERLKAWIDADRVANGLKPRYAVAQVAEQDDAPALRTSAQSTPAPQAEPDPKNLLEYVQNFGLPEPISEETKSPDGNGAESPEAPKTDQEEEDETRDDPNRASECAEIRAALPEVNDKIGKITDRIEDVKDEAKRLTGEIQALEKSLNEPTWKPQSLPRPTPRPGHPGLEAARVILKVAFAVWKAYSEAEKRRKIEEGISERKSELARVERELAEANAEWDAQEKELFRLHGRRVELKCDDSSPYDQS